MTQPYVLGVEYEEHCFLGAQHTRLHLHHWHGHNEKESKADVIILHGYMEHGGRYRHLAHVLAAHNFRTWAWDARGHGKSQGLRGYCRSFADYHEDLDKMLRYLAQKRDAKGPAFIMGHSFGGLLAIDYVASHDPNTFLGLIVTNPYLRSAMHVPSYKRAIGRVAAKIAPFLSLPSGIKRQDLTHDQTALEAHARDPLMLSMANAGWWREVGIAQKRVLAQSTLAGPTLAIIGNDDPIAAPQATLDFLQHNTGAKTEVWRRPNELHEVLWEHGRETLMTQIALWMSATQHKQARLSAAGATRNTR